ncbi:MAG: hypothetical protein IPJ61_06765 [Tessaracoccus sp.]|nr:hypothetical protein [Tessaracoccus sp.]MBK7820773.1 hypothetical protein [Tessaracoccus sp.]
MLDTIAPFTSVVPRREVVKAANRVLPKSLMKPRLQMIVCRILQFCR